MNFTKYTVAHIVMKYSIEWESREDFQFKMIHNDTLFVYIMSSVLK